MTSEEIWRRKSDEELLEASARLEEYTVEGQRVIVAELQRRRQTGRLDEAILPEVEGTDAATGGTPADVPSDRGNLLVRLWRGQVPLATTYWGYGVVGNIGCAVLLVGASEMLPPLAALLVGIVVVAYSVLTLVAIWRSAGRYAGSAAWSTLARISVATTVARIAVRLLAGVFAAS